MIDLTNFDTRLYSTNNYTIILIILHYTMPIGMPSICIYHAVSANPAIVPAYPSSL